MDHEPQNDQQHRWPSATEIALLVIMAALVILIASYFVPEIRITPPMEWGKP